MVSVEPTAIPDVRVVRARVFADDRGWFAETFRAEHFAAAGLPTAWVQDNRSRSRRNVVRGLHYQRRRPQAKLVWCTVGKVWDVAVDLRPWSPTFGRWVAVELTDEPGTALFIPEGFAHGFCALTERADLAYKCTAPYDPTDDLGVRWDDPALAIPWPVRDPSVSPKDAAQPTLAEAQAAGDRLPLAP